MRDLRAFAPTLCRLMEVPPPALAAGKGFDELRSSGGRIKKALIYCPDAFGLHALARFPALHERLRACSTHEIELASVFPPRTPVCFASLFTGGAPADHGITTYARPVLACDTLFDALVRARKKVAIAAVKDSSIDLIFRGRPLDYFSPADDAGVTLRALELLKDDRHDVIVVYHQEYDDRLHDTPHFSAASAAALERHASSWELLAAAAAQAWTRDYLLAFTPDHGGHLDPATGRGDHGEDRPEDMELRHFFVLK